MSADVALVTLALSGDAGAQRQLAVRLLDVVHRVVVDAIGNADANAVGVRVQEVFVALLERDAEELRRWDPDDGTTLDTCVVRIARRRLGIVLAAGSGTQLRSEDEPSSGWTPLQGDAREAVLAKILARLDQGETLAEHGDDLRALDPDAPRDAPTHPDLPFPPRDDRATAWRPTTVHLLATIAIAIGVASAVAIWAG